VKEIWQWKSCRWATWLEQANNTRSNVLLTYDGETRTAAEWARITGLNVATIRQRKKRGWTDTQILTTPPDVRFQLILLDTLFGRELSMFHIYLAVIFLFHFVSY
jgi:hypothetical protein